MTHRRFLTNCESKTGLFSPRLYGLNLFLSGRHFSGKFLNKFAYLPLSKDLMANMRVYYL